MTLDATPRFDILVVEDQPDTIIGTLTNIRLAVADLALDFADNAAAARSKMRDNDYGVLLVDLRLPDSDVLAVEEGKGIGLIEELRSGALGVLNQEKPCVLITAQTVYAERLRRLAISVDTLEAVSGDSDYRVYSKNASIFPLIKRLVDIIERHRSHHGGGE